MQELVSGLLKNTKTQTGITENKQMSPQAWHYSMQQRLVSFER